MIDQPLVRHSPIPLYRQVRDELARRIDAKEMEPEEMTSEQELATDFGVSRITIRHALDQLEHEGRVMRIPGKGTFASDRRKLEPQSALTSFSENIRALGKEPGHRTLKVSEVPASADIAKRLEIREDEIVLRIERLLLADGTPMAVMRAHLPRRVYHLSPEAFTPHSLDTTSLYEILEKELGLRLWKAKETVEAMTASNEEASLLDLQPHDLLLVVHRHTLDREARPVESTQLRYRADLYRYQVELFREPSRSASL